MDPMLDFVRDRTSDLQRLADDVRRERDLRTSVTDPLIAPAAIVASPRRLEPATPAEVAEVSCDPCASTATARHAA